MSKVLLSLSLIAALSAPAFAAEKTETTAEPRHEQAAPADAQGNVRDPNWKPCKYDSERDPNGCE